MDEKNDKAQSAVCYFVYQPDISLVKARQEEFLNVSFIKIILNAKKKRTCDLSKE